MADNRILIKNNYYPDGLTSGVVQNYYKKVQRDILLETQHKTVALMKFPKVNERDWVYNVKGKPIMLSNRRIFNKIIDDETLSIYSNVNQLDRQFVIALECANLNNMFVVCQFLSDLFLRHPSINDIEIYFDGVNGFYLHIIFVNKTDIERALYIIERAMFDNQDTKRYLTVNQKNSDKNIPNINLGYMKSKAMYICPNSLSEKGLRCAEIKLEDIPRFNAFNYMVK